MDRLKKILIISACYALVACNGGSVDEMPIDEAIVCSGLAEPAVRITVTDKESGLASALDATVIVTEGDYLEELTCSSNCDDENRFDLGLERAGTYQVTVNKEGFDSWIMNDVVAEQADCGPVTVSLQAELVKTPIFPEPSIDFLCTAIALPAISVNVFDFETGNYVGCDTKAIITSDDLSYTEEVNHSVTTGCTNQESISLANAREGVYNVEITKDGYKKWTQAGLKVTRDQCHVRTITLDTYLQKE